MRVPHSFDGLYDASRAASAPLFTTVVGPRAHANTRSAISELCHVRLPCAGTPWPARAARTSHAPLAPPDAGARALTPRRARRSAPLTAVCAHCTSACTFFRHHTAPERDATGKTLHREARAAARRARRPPISRYVTRAGLLCSLHADCTAALLVLNIQPACSALRPCRHAPGLHCTRRARGTLRARSAIRSVRCPVCLHTAQSTHCQPACTHS